MGFSALCIRESASSASFFVASSFEVARRLVSVTSGLSEPLTGGFEWHATQLDAKTLATSGGRHAPLGGGGAVDGVVSVGAGVRPPLVATVLWPTLVPPLLALVVAEGVGLPSGPGESAVPSELESPHAQTIAKQVVRAQIDVAIVRMSLPPTSEYRQRPRFRQRAAFFWSKTARRHAASVVDGSVR
jgi:hypothetical protein